MKRSELNFIIGKAIVFLNAQNFRLPPFAFWSPQEWARKGREVDEIRDCMLGWDITDFGSGAFAKVGLVIFTIRNGHMQNPKYTYKPYCEKVLISDVKQVTPMHFHWSKVEDIINRAGGNLVIRFYNSTKTDGLAGSPVILSVDGVETKIKAGAKLVLKPGQSVCIPSRVYHTFWAEKSMVLTGEVSKVNDDNIDNRFHGKIGRFPAIEENVPPRYLLFSEYPR